ncbi:MAG: hypothetical protein H0V82_07530 [Candidatus Protochlamydia sp.]|nr:hypothetical protein [Candidatus Protochlamydia sp.]
MKRYLSAALCFFLLSSHLIHAQEWVAHWFEGTHHARKKDFNQAIDKYSQAIGILEQTEPFTRFHLYNERGETYLNQGLRELYHHAIEDFTVVINSPDSSLSEKADAMWWRSCAYSRLGEHEHCKRDLSELDRIQPIYIVNYVEDEDYVVFKMADRLRNEKKLEGVFINMLLKKRSILSVNDVIFTTSGMGIIKKSKSVDAPQGPFFQ